MQLENVVFDAVDPRTLGRSWESRLGTRPLTDEEAGYETRLAVPDGPVIDLCFQRVAEPPTGPQRVHLEVDEDTGSLAAIAVEVADPQRDRDFWSWLTGWQAVDAGAAVGLRHPSALGPLLELRPESAPKGDGKNQIHLDVRLERGEDADAVAREITAHGGRELHFDWGDLPWRHFADPSGNEFCVLPASS